MPDGRISAAVCECAVECCGWKWLGVTVVVPPGVRGAGRWTTCRPAVTDYVSGARRGGNIAVTFRESEVACSTWRYTSGRLATPAHSLTSFRRRRQLEPFTRPCTV